MMKSEMRCQCVGSACEACFGAGITFLQTRTHSRLQNTLLLPEGCRISQLKSGYCVILPAKRKKLKNRKNPYAFHCMVCSIGCAEIRLIIDKTESSGYCIPCQDFKYFCTAPDPCCRTRDPRLIVARDTPNSFAIVRCGTRAISRRSNSIRACISSSSAGVVMSEKNRFISEAEEIDASTANRSFFVLFPMHRVYHDYCG